MPCGCETYQCIEVLVNPCNTGTVLPIEATETGTYTAQVWFNGTVKQLGVQADSGDNLILLTSVLNEQYTHELRLTSPSGVLTCYTARTYPSFNVSGAPVPPPVGSVWEWFEVVGNGNIVQSDLWAGQISPEIYLDGNPIDWEQAGIVRVDDTLDFTAVGGANGVKITGMYKL